MTYDEGRLVEQVAGADRREADGEGVVPGVDALPPVVLVVPGRDAAQLGHEAFVVGAAGGRLVALGEGDHGAGEWVGPTCPNQGASAWVSIWAHLQVRTGLQSVKS